MEPYYTIVVPFVEAPFATEWHPTERSGPLSTVTRGNFPAEADAIRWAQTRLNGTPYSIRLIKDESDSTECDECGALIPDDEPSMVNAHHDSSCSLHASKPWP